MLKLINNRKIKWLRRNRDAIKRLAGIMVLFY